MGKKDNINKGKNRKSSGIFQRRRGRAAVSYHKLEFGASIAFNLDIQSVMGILQVLSSCQKLEKPSE